MLHPLASLCRHPGRAAFYQSGILGLHVPMLGDGLGPSRAMISRRRFSSADEAFHYLRCWLGEPAARAELKSVLQRSGPSLVNAHAGSDGWVHALAGRLASGAVVVLEENSRFPMPGRLVAPGSASSSAADIAALPLLSTVAPASAVAPDLSPAPGEQAMPSVDSSAAPAASPVAVVAPVEAPAALDPESPQMAVQLAQAETLEQAAISGTPFCEICAKHAKALAEANHE